MANAYLDLVCPGNIFIAPDLEHPRAHSRVSELAGALVL